VQRLIDLWLSIAKPPLDPANGPWFYDEFGRALNGRNVYANGSPDWAAYRYRFLWEHARDLDSVAHGTLWEFVNGMLRSGRFEPAPTRVPDGSGGGTSGTGPESTGLWPPANPTSGRDLYERVERAVRERHLEWMYDVFSRRKKKEIDDMLAELRRQAESGEIPASRRSEMARQFGFEDFDRLLGASGRAFLHHMGKTADVEELVREFDWVEFVGEEIEPGGRRGTLITREKENRIERTPLVREDGGWRVDPE
jgi:hypothetical protein